MSEVLIGAKRRHLPSGHLEAAASAGAANHAVDSAAQPSPLEAMIAVAIAIVQQTAFIFVPALLAGSSINPTTYGAAPNPSNTAAVAANGVAVAALCLIHRRRVWSVVRGNRAAVLLAILVVASTLWSIHPEITFRRSGGYLITMLSAVYLSSRFTTDQVMTLLSWSFALSALGSFIFVALYPQSGIMQGPYLGGDWLGVYPHKNVLGYAMSVGVFVECYILAGAGSGWRRHLALLGCFLALVVLSRSATGMVCSACYLMGACGYVLWTRASRFAAIASTATVLLGLLAAVVVWAGPISAFALIGKDATFSGRTALWPPVLDLIGQKPLLGWGYGAMWLADDSNTIAIAKAIGWVPTHAHNAVLEVALELGSLGVAVLVGVVIVSLWRGASCLYAGQPRLAAFSFTFFVTLVLYGFVEATLVQNQSIMWVVCNILSFAAGLEIVRLRSRKKRPETQAVKPILSRAKPLALSAARAEDAASRDPTS